MKEKANPQPTESTSDLQAAPTGVVPRVVHLALDAADRGQSTTISVLQDARAELRIAVDGGLELTEKLAAGALRFARKVVDKLDGAGAAALVSTERALATAVSNARATTQAARELAASAASGVAGSRAA